MTLAPPAPEMELVEAPRTWAPKPVRSIPSPWRERLIASAAMVILASAAIAALIGGLAARNWLWTHSADTLRFHGDIHNAWAQGVQIRQIARNLQRRQKMPVTPEHEPLPWPAFFRGYLAMYDEQAQTHPDDRYSLDYAPLRLLMMSAWTNHELNLYPDLGDVDDPSSWPLLMMNTLLTVTAVAATYLIVVIVLGRAQSAAPLARARWRRIATGIWTRPLLGRRRPAAPLPLTPRHWPRHSIVVGAFALAAVGSIYLAIAAYMGNFALQASQPPSANLWIVEAIAFAAALVAIANFPAPWRRHGAAMLTGLALWFYPALLLETHAWPQWDTWAIATYLLATLLTLLDCGFAAGIVIAFGSMFKAQVLFVAPALGLFLLFKGRPIALLRMALGFAAAFTLCGAVWLVPDPAAWMWILIVCVAAVISMLVWRVWRTTILYFLQSTPGISNWFPKLSPVIPGQSRALTIARLLILLVLIRALFAVGFAMPRLGLPAPWMSLLTLAILLTPLGVAAIGYTLWFTALLASSIWLASFAFGGSLNWLWVGFAYGTRHFHELHIGDTTNLGKILKDSYDFTLDSQLTFSAPWRDSPVTLGIKPLMIGMFAIALVFSALGAAMHDQRRDPRLLVALAAPWVIMFTLLPQMHERYGIFAGCVCCIGLAAGAAPALFSLIIMLSAIIPVYLGEEVCHADQWPVLGHVVTMMAPGAAWMMLLAAAGYLWISIAPRKRRNGAV